MSEYNNRSNEEIQELNHSNDAHELLKKARTTAKRLKRTWKTKDSLAERIRQSLDYVRSQYNHIYESEIKAIEELAFQKGVTYFLDEARKNVCINKDRSKKALEAAVRNANGLEADIRSAVNEIRGSYSE